MLENTQTAAAGAVSKTAIDRNESEVLSSINRLEGAARCYGDLVDKLSDRLNSVLSSVPPTGVNEGDVKEPISCDLVSQLNSICEKINAANDTSQSILSRLQL